MNKKVTIYQDINHLSSSYGDNTEVRVDSDCVDACELVEMSLDGEDETEQDNN